MSNEVYDLLLMAVFAAAAVVFAVLMFISAPYGKQERDGWGPGLPMRLGWCVLELPAFAGMAWCFMQGEQRASAVPLLLFGLWQLHYFHRSFIYPLRLRVKPEARYKIALLVPGMLFNAANGALNGWFLAQLGTHLQRADWLADPRFIGGLILFAVGFGIAKHSDAVLRNLRQPGETGYKIPFGGLYRWVSCPNYLGEMLQWGGFALAAWSPPALAFVAFTAANLVPKAISSHRWYRQQFADYPPERKAVFPGVL